MSTEQRNAPARETSLVEEIFPDIIAAAEARGEQRGIGRMMRAGTDYEPPAGALKLPDGADGETRWLLNAGQYLVDLAERVAKLEAAAAITPDTAERKASQ